MTTKRVCIPFVQSPVHAGFPSPAEDYIEGKLDIGEYLIKNPASTFFVRVQGESMIHAGIFPHDILVVDKSLSPQHHQVVVAILNGEFTVKRLVNMNGKFFLASENPHYPPIHVSAEDECEIWGVVTAVIHKP